MAGAGNDYFNQLHRRLLGKGRSPVEARQAVFEAFLDGKPQPAGRLKQKRADRDRWFWASALLCECRPEDWGSEAGMLVLTRYLSQD